ncbi:MAG: hypothetical protein HDR15_00025 [Lachnospiraceae bacterium]|nr:hypothetical protein [Lachnospiraceae bacterium]
MLKMELYKICKRRIVFVAFIVLFGLTMTFSIVQLLPNYTANIAVTENGVLNGREGLQYNINLARSYKGTLTDELVHKGIDGYDGESEYSSPLYYFFWRFVLFGTDDAISVEDWYHEIDFDIHFGYYSGWFTLVSNWISITYLFPILIVIAFAPLFSYEAQSGMYGILLTTKNGRKKCTRSKILASFFLMNIAWILLAAVLLIAGFFIFGLEGYDTSIQIGWAYYNYESVLPFSYMKLLLHIFLIDFLTFNSILFIVILISFRSKSPFTATCIGLAILYIVRTDAIGAFFDNNILDHVMSLTPANVLDGEYLASFQPIHFGGYQIQWICFVELFYIVVLLAVIGVLMRALSRNQKYFID